MAGNIIAFSGRLGSGKSELASVCIKHGYEKLYFALPLKLLVSELLSVNLKEINSLKQIDAHYCFGKKDFEFISDKTKIPIETVTKAMSGKTFNNVREILQFVGTNLIREYNKNWHVDRIREMIKDDTKYVIDDVRFPNELELVEELGGDAWFIVRPTIENVSNHESETSLLWKDFGDRVIINDSTLELFRDKWDIFVSSYDKSIARREEFLNGANELTKIYSAIKEPLSVMDVLEISPYFFEYKERKYNKEDICSITNSDGLGVVLTKKDGSVEIIKNPLNIEDLKICI